MNPDLPAVNASMGSYRLFMVGIFAESGLKPFRVLPTRLYGVDPPLKPDDAGVRGQLPCAAVQFAIDT